MTLGLSRGQRKVFLFVGAFSKEHGYAPTLAEIAQHFGWAGTTAAKDSVVALVKKGFLRREPRIARSIRPTDKGAQFLALHDPKEFNAQADTQNGPPTDLPEGHRDPEPGRGSDAA